MKLLKISVMMEIIFLWGKEKTIKRINLKINSIVAKKKKQRKQ